MSISGGDEMMERLATERFVQVGKCMCYDNMAAYLHARPENLIIVLWDKSEMKALGKLIGVLPIFSFTIIVCTMGEAISADSVRGEEIERRIIFEGFSSDEVDGIDLYLVEFKGYVAHSILESGPERRDLLFKSQASEGQLHDDLARMLKYLGVVGEVELRQGAIRVVRPVPADGRPRGLATGRLGGGPRNLQLTSARGPTPVYRIGEDLELHITLDKDSWIYCFYLQANGSLVMLFPNRYHKLAWLDGGRNHDIAGDDKPFSLTVTEPTGEETLHCFATGQRLDSELPVDLRDMEGASLNAPLSHRLLEAFRTIPGVAITEATLSITVTR